MGSKKQGEMMKTPIEQLISRLVTLRDEAEGFSAEVEAYERAINEAESLLKHEAKEMKTIAQELGIKDFPYEIKDGNGRVIYYEEADGYWEKKAYDSEGNEIYLEDDIGYWVRREYDSEGNEIYYENSFGEVIDSRPKEDVITLNGVKYKRIDE